MAKAEKEKQVVKIEAKKDTKWPAAERSCFRASNRAGMEYAEEKARVGTGSCRAEMEQSGSGVRIKRQASSLSDSCADRRVRWSADPDSRREIGRRIGKLRVAAYCRVSTLLHSQESSIESQEAHYRQKIQSRTDWELAGIYLEAGASGTKAEKRPELQRLLEDCGAGRVDLILTKSISRFARNTTECLEMVRMLTSLDVSIYFEKENIHTGTMESELMLSLLACFAEVESRNISGNMKWGIRKRFADGTYRQPVPPYGYVWRDGQLVAEREQAEVVGDMFSMALAGRDVQSIARALNEQKIPSPRGGKWSPAGVRYILTNPAYVGDTFYQKTYMDHGYHQRINRGELDWYYEQAHHQPIVNRVDFREVQRRVKPSNVNGVSRVNLSEYINHGQLNEDSGEVIR